MFVVAAMLGVLSGVLFAYAGDLPEISALDNYNPSTITRVRAANGTIIGEFAVQRRIVVGYDDISPNFRQAIVAAEDASFDSHVGLSVTAIAARLTRDIFEGIGAVLTHRKLRPAGASTLTQQLARTLFPEAVGYQIGDISPERKIKEIIVAVQIEKRYTKREILTCTRTRCSSATAPSVSKRLRACTSRSGERPVARGGGAARGHRPVSRPAESVRQHGRGDASAQLRAATDGGRGLHHGGAGAGREGRRRSSFTDSHSPTSRSRRSFSKRCASISSANTVRRRSTRAASRSRRRSIRRCRRRPTAHPGRASPRWTSGEATASPRGTSSRKGKPSSRTRTNAGRGRWPSATSCRQSLPRSASPRRPTARGCSIGRYHADLTKEAGRRTASTGRAAPRPRTCSSRAMSSRWRFARWTRRPAPHPSSSNRRRSSKARSSRSTIVPVRSSDGRRVGLRPQQVQPGRAGDRQIGSTFKPIVYTTAIDRGFTPASILIDEPVSYAPAATAAVHPAELRSQVRGADHAAARARRLPQHSGDQDDGRARPEERAGVRKAVRLRRRLPAVSAHCAGSRRRDAHGSDQRLHGVSQSGRPHDAVRHPGGQGPRGQPARGESRGADRRHSRRHGIRHDEPAARRRVCGGPAEAAASIDWPLAGKTGTVDENTDAWFIGFDPDITVGVWVGL